MAGALADAISFQRGSARGTVALTVRLRAL